MTFNMVLWWQLVQSWMWCKMWDAELNLFMVSFCIMYWKSFLTELRARADISWIERPGFMDNAWRYFESGTMSIEILKDDLLQKTYFNVRDRVRLWFHWYTKAITASQFPGKFLIELPCLTHCKSEKFTLLQYWLLQSFTVAPCMWIHSYLSDFVHILMISVICVIIMQIWGFIFITKSMPTTE